jgi:putative N-acetylmannosamine-6-phosphate epimerase
MRTLAVVSSIPAISGRSELLLPNQQLIVNCDGNKKELLRDVSAITAMCAAAIRGATR